MYTLIISLIILFAVLLVLVILAQNSKGGGLTSQFGGSSATNIIGVKKTGDLLEKLTWSFIVAIVVLILATNFVDNTSSGPTNDALERAGEQAPVQQPNLNLPGATEEAPASDSAGQQ